jgi:hypothetical protein
VSGEKVGGVDGRGRIRAVSTEGGARRGREERVWVVPRRREVQMQWYVWIRGGRIAIFGFEKEGFASLKWREDEVGGG